MTTENLERAFASTRAVIANVKPAQLASSTPCQSWDVKAILNHVIGGSFWFADTVNASSAPPFPEEDFTAGDMLATYDDGIKQSVAAFGTSGAQEKMLTLPFGTLPCPAFMGIATTDAFTHGWDLAQATGQSVDLDPELAVQLLAQARQFIQPAFRGEDGKSPFGAEQPAPAGATAADALAAFLGRRA